MLEKDKVDAIFLQTKDDWAFCCEVPDPFTRQETEIALSGELEYEPAPQDDVIDLTKCDFRLR